jgi:hypothetical protein
VLSARLPEFVMIDITPSTPSQTFAWSLLRAPLASRLAVAVTAIVLFWLAVLAAFR